MDIHAYPTEAITPVEQPEARRLADRYLTSEEEAALGITNQLAEFDSCFVVTAVFPPQRAGDAHAPAVVVGGSVCVIDKTSGAISYWPTYPAEMVAEQYAAALRQGSLIIEQGWPQEDRPDEQESRGEDGEPS